MISTILQSVPVALWGFCLLKILFMSPVLCGEECGGDGGVKSMGMKLLRSSSILNETQEATHNTLTTKNTQASTANHLVDCKSVLNDQIENVCDSDQNWKVFWYFKWCVCMLRWTVRIWWTVWPAEPSSPEERLSPPHLAWNKHWTSETLLWRCNTWLFKLSWI